MIRVMQTKFGAEGNCFDACIASLLEMPLEQVDYFRGEDTWYKDLQIWLEPMGLGYVEVDLKHSPLYHFPLPLLVKCGGPSPRGVEGGHAVVALAEGLDFKTIHDPHPDGTGLVAVESVGFFVKKFDIGIDVLASVLESVEGAEFRYNNLKGTTNE